MPVIWARSPPTCWTVSLKLRAKDWCVHFPLLSPVLLGAQGSAHFTVWLYMKPTLGGSSHGNALLGTDT